MDLTTLGTGKLDVLLVDGFGLALLSCQVVDGTASALRATAFYLIAFLLSHDNFLLFPSLWLVQKAEIDNMLKPYTPQGHTWSRDHSGELPHLHPAQAPAQIYSHSGRW